MNTVNQREFLKAADARLLEANTPSCDILDVPASEPLRDFALATGCGLGIAGLAYAVMTRPLPETISSYFMERALPEGGGVLPETAVRDRSLYW